MNRMLVFDYTWQDRYFNTHVQKVMAFSRKDAWSRVLWMIDNGFFVQFQQTIGFVQEKEGGINEKRNQGN